MKDDMKFALWVEIDAYFFDFLDWFVYTYNKYSIISIVLFYIQISWTKKHNE